MPAIPIPPSTLMAPVFTSPRVLSVVFVKDETPTKVDTPVTTKSSRSVRPSTSKLPLTSISLLYVVTPAMTIPDWNVATPTNVDTPVTFRVPILALPEISTSALISKFAEYVETPVTTRSSRSV